MGEGEKERERGRARKRERGRVGEQRETKEGGREKERSPCCCNSDPYESAGQQSSLSSEQPSSSYPSLHLFLVLSPLFLPFSPCLRAVVVSLSCGPHYYACSCHLHCILSSSLLVPCLHDDGGGGGGGRCVLRGGVFFSPLAFDGGLDFWEKRHHCPPKQVEERQSCVRRARVD